MISNWKDQERFKGNEEIEIGQDSLDSRGTINNFYIDDTINMIVMLNQAKNRWGNHYHPIQTQNVFN